MHVIARHKKSMQDRPQLVSAWYAAPSLAEGTPCTHLHDDLAVGNHHGNPAELDLQYVVKGWDLAAEDRKQGTTLDDPWMGCCPKLVVHKLTPVASPSDSLGAPVARHTQGSW